MGLFAKRMLLAAALVSGAAGATTYNVSGDGTTIQDAVNAAQDGDTILIAPGTHTVPNIQINKTIVVAGASTTSPTKLVPASGSLFIFTVYGGTPTIRGLDLDGGGVPGIGVECFAGSTSSCRVDSCTITGFNQGMNVLTVEANPAVVVVNSTITGNEYGLILQDQEGTYPPRDGEHVRLL